MAGTPYAEDGVTTFRAYHDLAWSPGQMDSNIATFGAGQSGLLVDYDTGGVSDRIELTVGDTASLNHSLGENAPRRTDAYQAFGGKVDCRGALCASGSGATLRLTFSGLDPSKLYECVFFANRGGTRYGHWKEDAFITLEEADSFRNESSPGTGYAGADDPRTLIIVVLDPKVFLD